MTDASEYPLVTLALFTYNQENFIEEAIRSALAQDYAPLEIIISDDCSTDKTYSVIEASVASYQGPHTLVVRRNSTNQGLVGHINTVLAVATGEFVCWVAGDDISMIGKVAALVAPMLRDVEVAGVHSYVNEIDESGRFLRTRKPPMPAQISTPHEVIEREMEIISQSHAFRRSVWEKFGAMEAWVTNESPVMAFREACCGKIVLVPEMLTNYRVGVGVSTLRGRTVRALSVDEPTKYARWWSSSYRQICFDKSRAGLSAELESLIEGKSQFFDDLLTINEKSWAIGTLLSNISHSRFRDLFRAFVRRNTPRFVLWTLYRRRGWL